MPYVIEHNKNFFNTFNIEDKGYGRRLDSLLFYGVGNYKLYETKNEAIEEIDNMIEQLSKIPLTDKNKRNIKHAIRNLKNSNIVERRYR